MHDACACQIYVSTFEYYVFPIIDLTDRLIILSNYGNDVGGKQGEGADRSW
jgi:hypothetical protein